MSERTAADVIRDFAEWLFKTGGFHMTKSVQDELVSRINYLVETQRESGPLKPNLALLSKLGSIVVHAEEAMSIKAHHYDRIALQTLLADSEVRNWIDSMGVYLPVKR